MNRTTFGLSLLLGIPLAIALLVVLTLVFYEGRKAYWDSKVDEMCQADGGVTVNDRVAISKVQYEALPRVEGFIGIPPKSIADSESPVFGVTNETVIRAWNPRVIRVEHRVTRRSDGRVVGYIVSYARIGGDIPTGLAHESHRLCPAQSEIHAKQEQFFVVGGEK